MNKKYSDIINFPHPVSKKHPQMSMYNRAAQFAPFAALSGHNDAINETARLTSSKIILSPEEKIELSRKLTFILSHINEEPLIEIVYFVEDKQKNGGEYKIYNGKIKKFDEFGNRIIFSDNQIIYLSDILTIKCSSLFNADC